MKKLSLLLLVLLSGLTINKTIVTAQEALLKDLKNINQVVALASSLGPWETIRQDQGVSLISRWLSFGDTLKTREISSRFVVNTNMQGILTNLVEPDRFKDWNDGVRSVRVFSRDDTSWITHIVYDIPQPFSQQDLVIMHEMKTHGRKILVNMYAVPDYVPPLKNINRQRLYFGQWELRALNSKQTEVSFSAISFSKTNIPRFLRDPIIQNKLIRSFIRLKEQS